MKLACGSIIRSGGLFWGGKRPQSDATTVCVTNMRQPTIIARGMMHAFISAGITAAQCYMLLILPLCGEPKVRSYAIQPITVNVVNKLVWFWLQYKAMKQFFSVSLWADMHMMQGVHLLTGLQNPPFILIDAIEIFVVNIRDIALGKWNASASAKSY